MMKLKIILLALLLTISTLALSEEQRGVPIELFGIPLGSSYELSKNENSSYDNFPIKKFTGMNQFMGHGLHFYFQPKKEYKEFTYIEKRDKPDDKYYKTSFRLYLYPIVPNSVNDKKELIGINLKWEVVLIEWSDKSETEEDAYYWTKNICEIFSEDLKIKPEENDHFEEKWHQCKFLSNNRVFEVSNLSELKIVKLEYKKDYLEKKSRHIEKVINKVKADEIRPY